MMASIYHRRIIIHGDKSVYMWDDFPLWLHDKNEEGNLKELQTLTIVNHFLPPRLSWPDRVVPALAMLASCGVHNEKNGAVSHNGSLNSIFCFISHT